MRRILDRQRLVVAAFFGGTLWALDIFFGDAAPSKRPALAAPPPLKPVTRHLDHHRAGRDRQRCDPRRDGSAGAAQPQRQARQSAERSARQGRHRLDHRRAGRSRSPARTDGAGRSSTTLNGSLRVTGQIAEQAGNLTGALGELLGGSSAASRQARRQARSTSAPTSAATSRDVAKPALHAELADRAQPHRQRRARRRRHEHRRHQAQRVQRGEAAARPDRERADRQRCRRSCATTARWNRPRAREWAKMCRSISLGAGRARRAEPVARGEADPAFAAQPQHRCRTG